MKYELYLFVSVQRNEISIIKESATSIKTPGTIADLFLTATSFHELPPTNIQICFQAYRSLQWHDIKMDIWGLCNKKGGNSKKIKNLNNVKSVLILAFKI